MKKKQKDSLPQSILQTPSKESTIPAGSIVKTKEIVLFGKQDEAIFAPQRFKAYVGGLQSGKTISGAVWSRIQYDQSPMDTGLICAPTYKILQQSTLPKFFEINPDLKRFHRKVDGTIEVPNRGVIYIRSTENPNVIEGMTLKWIWADEAGQMSIDAWVNFQGRLSILKGNLFCTTTPYTLNWLYTDFYGKWQGGNPDYAVFQCRSCDNPYFPKDEYDRVKSTMDPRTFRRRYDGLFEKMEGLVYEDFVPSVHVIDPQKINFKEVIAGVDWGYTNQASIVIIGIDKDNCYYVIDEYYRTGKTTSEIIEQCHRFIKEYKVRFFYPDSAEPDRLEEMRRAGIHPREVNKSKKSVIKGIDTVREVMRENKFRVFSSCKYFLEELSLYHYPEAEGIVEDEVPVKENDHLLDALRYAIYTYKPVRRVFEKKTYKSVNSITGY